MVLGGEEVYKRDLDLFKKHFFPGCNFVNLFGSTESSLGIQYFINHKTEIAGNTVPIGYPVEDTEISLLDETGEENGIHGEIALMSPHVA